MRDNLLIGGSTILFVVFVVAIASFTKPPDPPLPTTCRLLDCDPEFYAGKLVKLKTDGMEIDDHSKEYFFRKQTDKPHIVVCRFKSDRLPEKMPASIVGLCIGRQGESIIVIDCH